MIVKCVECHHEAQVVNNIDPCDWCESPMKSIGSDYMSDCDDSITSHTIDVIVDEDAELPLDFMLGGVDSRFRYDHGD